MKRHVFCIIGAAILIDAVLPEATVAAPQVFIYTDKDSYFADETIELSLGGENYDEPVSVDVYVGLVGRDGALCTLSEAGWGTYLEPWMPDVLVPNPYYMAAAPFQWFDLPCAMPPIREQGEYSFAAGLTHPGTLEFLSDIGFAPFTIDDREAHIYVSAAIGDDANDGSLDSPYKTITHAIASAEGSEAHPVTIHVAAGKYAESTNGETFPLNMKSWVSLEGADAETTVLDAEQEGCHVIDCESVDNATIEGFTITGGAGVDYVGRGGGILCSRSSLRIRGNVVSQNSASYGAGIYCSDGSSPIIEGNTISDNSAGYRGGGMYCDETSSANIRNNCITGNSATLGGALYYHAENPPTIENNTISGNSARYGAGIYCLEPEKSTARGAGLSMPMSRLHRTALFEDTFNITDCVIWATALHLATHTTMMVFIGTYTAAPGSIRVLSRKRRARVISTITRDSSPVTSVTTTSARGVRVWMPEVGLQKRRDCLTEPRQVPKRRPIPAWLIWASTIRYGGAIRSQLR